MKARALFSIILALFIATSVSAQFKYTTGNNGTYIGNVYGNLGQIPYAGTKGGQALTSDVNFYRTDSSQATYIGNGSGTSVAINANGITFTYGGQTWTQTGPGVQWLDSISTFSKSGTATLAPNRGTNIVDSSDAVTSVAITLPGSPRNGDIVVLSFTFQCGTITFSGTAPEFPISAVTGGNVVGWIWSSAKTKWCKWAGNL